MDGHDYYVVGWFSSKARSENVSGFTYTIEGLVPGDWHVLSVHSERLEEGSLLDSESATIREQFTRRFFPL